MKKKIQKSNTEFNNIGGFIKDHNRADGPDDIFDGHIKDYRNVSGNPADADYDCLYDSNVTNDPVLYEECINRDMGWDEDVELGYSLKETQEKKESGFDSLMSKLGSVLTQVDKGADIFTKLKTGTTTTTKGGASYDVSLGGQPIASAPTQDNTTWYIVGGVIIVLAVVAVVVMKGKK